MRRTVGGRDAARVSTPMKTARRDRARLRDEDMKKTDQKVEAKAPEPDDAFGAPDLPAPSHREERAVSRATLFTGSGPDGGGLIGSG